ncbi:mitochondrial 54S ribosomal protein uL5m NDAI_0C05060 [Naumovozyma dairenensis CBS 421]|uniref:Large ribosomal subunit protein uL5m n=1 Tax=Naumovozyma dairenensis (strain ATCC 10597 / BCRC 20456 / CBS 421 / NBRC 0211 / NRRL Y-12639) TaxID=1071378 RepID=G0W8Q4_NAUDC|nr:hypothetical protein NDAI_0C05060 [Naumovozyma dairenensis CBS 421]CCD24165.1 hypothetical protein NDAI_0C05060 [Naumovozyma dairenensis CBS 421]
MQKFLVIHTRGFSNTTYAQKAACSIVKPVHHLVKIDKNRLSPRFPELNYSKNDIRSPSFKPTETCQDRVREHYLNTIQPDLLLMNYQHKADIKEGLKKRGWDGTSPYHINRAPRKPKGSVAQFPDIHPIKWNNIPEIKNIVLNCYVKEAKENQLLAISAALQLQQITGCKPKMIYSKSDVPSWKVRKGHHMGAKVELSGYPMSQFLTTLAEIVLPRIREYKGISDKSGNRFGGLSFGLRPEDVRFFPEIDSNQDLWPRTFGMHININTTAQTDEQTRALVSAFQLPFHKA